MPSLIYLSIPVLCLEMALLVYVLLLDARDLRNRYYAAFMLLLVISTSGTLIQGTAETYKLAYLGAWMQTISIISAGPTVWLVILATFRPALLRRKPVHLFIYSLAIIPVIITALDLIFGTAFIFDFPPELYVENYQSLRVFLTGPLGVPAYIFSLFALSIGFVVPLLVFALRAQGDKRLRRTAWLLIGGVMVSGVVGSWARQFSPLIVSLNGPLLSAVVSAVAIKRYQVFSPVSIALREAVDAADTGILIFSQEQELIDANIAAQRLLDFKMSAHKIINLRMIINHLAKQAPLQRQELINMSEAISTKSGKYNLQIQVNSQIESSMTKVRHLNLVVKPVFDPYEDQIGYLCTVDDLSDEREAQAIIQQANRELQIASEIIQHLNGTMELEDSLFFVFKKVKEIAFCNFVDLFMFKEHVKKLRNIYDNGSLKIGGASLSIDPVNTAAANRVMSGELFLNPSIMSSTMCPLEILLRSGGSSSYASLPLQIGQHVTGMLVLGWEDPHGYYQRQMPLLRQITDALSLTIERARLLEQIQQRVAELESLSILAMELRQLPSVREILHTIIINLPIPDIAAGAIFLLNEQKNSFVVRSWYPLLGQMDLYDWHYRLGDSIVGKVSARGESHFSTDLLTDSLLQIPENMRLLFFNEGSAITLPLHSRERLVGIMLLQVKNRRHFSPGEVRLLRALANITASVLERELVLESLEETVTYRTQELAFANEQLKELDRLKSKFVSDVSHELRTPITNISLYIDLLEMDRLNKRENYLTILKHQAKRLGQLVEDILNLSRLETVDPENLDFSFVNLNEVIERVTAVHHQQAEAAGLDLIVIVDEPIPLVYGESNQLAQVVTNLLNNAINYTKTGYVRVCTFSDAKGERVCLQVEDTGKGLEPADQAHLFERFYRGQRTGSSNIPGTGLGLAIAKEIVDLHQGEIEVESQLGEGTTFRVWLPAYKSG